MTSSELTDALRRFDASQGPRSLGPKDGPYTDLGSVGVARRTRTRGRRRCSWSMGRWYG